MPTCGAFRGNSASSFEKQVLHDTVQSMDVNSGTTDRYINILFCVMNVHIIL